MFSGRQEPVCMGGGKGRRAGEEGGGHSNSKKWIITVFIFRI